MIMFHFCHLLNPVKSLINVLLKISRDRKNNFNGLPFTQKDVWTNKR